MLITQKGGGHILIYESVCPYNENQISTIVLCKYITKVSFAFDIFQKKFSTCVFDRI